MPSTLMFYLCTALATLCLMGQPAMAQSGASPFGNTGTPNNAPFGASQSPSFLTVEQAYQVDVQVRAPHLLVRWRAEPGYYLYRHGFRYRLDGQRLTPALPTGEIKHDENFGQVEVYYGDVSVQLPLPQKSASLELASQGCADKGLCYPPYKLKFRVDPATGHVSAESTSAPLVEPTAREAALPPASPPASLPLMLLFGLLGGLILNLMPCVFPVLTLKAVGFAKVEPRERLSHSAVYTAGVISSFLLVAGLMLALRSGGAAIGWGFQLQSPQVVGALAYLFLLLGLNLSGVFEFGGRWMGLGNEATAHPGLSGSFFTGVLAVVVASPCSAPFMGTALGFAVTQDTATALAVFAALGLGLALPMLLLAAAPGALRWLPRPGHWMLTLKQIMAYPLYASAIWLLWVLGRQTGVDGMATALAGCLLLTMAAWNWADRPSLNRLGRAVATTVAILSAAGAIALLNSAPLQARAEQRQDARWQPYSAERLAQLRQEGRAVFIDATADWCITCLANERLTLNTERVQQAFKAKNVALLQADWTQQDPAITALLSAHGRSGVPLYLLYVPGQDAPLILPQLLTPELVITALDALR